MVMMIMGVGGGGKGDQFFIRREQEHDSSEIPSPGTGRISQHEWDGAIHNPIHVTVNVKVPG